MKVLNSMEAETDTFLYKKKLNRPTLTSPPPSDSSPSMLYIFYSKSVKLPFPCMYQKGEKREP